MIKTQVIMQGGDTLIPKYRDPLFFDEGPEAMIRVGSGPGGKLMWGILQVAVEGLVKMLTERMGGWDGGETRFEIWDLDVGDVGVGEIY